VAQSLLEAPNASALQHEGFVKYDTYIVELSNITLAENGQPRGISRNDIAKATNITGMMKGTHEKACCS
jgi:hypothetical protein